MTKPVAQLAGCASWPSQLSCPGCRRHTVMVLDSRAVGNNKIMRRRRACRGCDHRWTTYEITAEMLSAYGERLPT